MSVCTRVDAFCVAAIASSSAAAAAGAALVSTTDAADAAASTDAAFVLVAADVVTDAASAVCDATASDAVNSAADDVSTADDIVAVANAVANDTVAVATSTATAAAAISVATSTVGDIVNHCMTSHVENKRMPHILAECVICLDELQSGDKSSRTTTRSPRHGSIQFNERYNTPTQSASPQIRFVRLQMANTARSLAFTLPVSMNVSPIACVSCNGTFTNFARHNGHSCFTTMKFI